MATRSGTPLVDDSDSRCLMPLPPGMVPSDSRENIIDLLPEGIKQENRFQTFPNPLHMNKENSVVHSMKTDNKPSYPPAECWSPSIEKQFSSLTIKTSKPPTYHIDLNSELKGDKEAGATKIKLSGPTWSPMRHKNKVVPQTDSQPPTAQKKKNGFLSSSEGSLLADDSRLSSTSSQRPYSAPQRTGGPATGIVISDEGEIQGLVEIHESYDGPPIYSEVIKRDHTSSDSSQDLMYAKIDKQQTNPHPSSLTSELPQEFGEEEKARYIQDLVAMSPRTYSSPIKRTTSTTSSIIQALQNRAEEANDNDSLYDSMREEDKGETDKNQYSEIADLNPKYFKGLKKHDDQGGVRLISIQGSIPPLPSDNLNISPLNQDIPPDMQMIHYVSAVGDKKSLEGVLSLLPITQDPVEMVLGSSKFQVRKGVDVRDGWGRTPLMHAVHNGHIDCVKLLAEAGANINLESTDGSTCLHQAAFSGTPQMMALLLSLGASGTKKDNEGRVPLHWATNNDDPECINLLLDKVPGQGPNVQDGAHMTPLMWAAYYGQAHNIEALKKRGADSTLSDQDGMKAIHWSIVSSNTQALKLLLSTESAGYRDNRGRAVMHVVAEQGFARAVEMIRSTRPLSVNDQDSNRRTPLHWATVCEKPEVLRALTAAGADPSLYDSSGMTALDYAVKRGLHYCGLLLAQAIEEHHDREAAIGYHRVFSVGEAASIGVRTLMQQEGKLGEIDSEREVTEEHVLQMKAVCTGGWINKFTNKGKGPLHCRFFWVDPTNMTIHWSKCVESRYVSSKDTKYDKLIGVRTSAGSSILHRKDFDPLNKHKFAFTIFTSNRVLDMVAISSDDYKIWLNGIQLLVQLGSEAANKIMSETHSRTSSQ